MTTTTTLPSLTQAAAPFLDYLEEWQESLAPLSLTAIIEEAGGPEKVAIFSVDIINGFCHEGNLQSDRVKGIIAPIADLMTHAHAQGVRRFVLTQDAHPEDAVEFKEFPPHCIRGTSEAETVPELTALPFASIFEIIPKRSTNSAIETGLDDWLAANPGITHRIVVGDCTDLCTYQLAMHLKLSANANNHLHPVILPADCVQTYDLPVEVARNIGVPAHPGDLFHAFFLYHMALNGVRVVRNIT